MRNWATGRKVATRPIDGDDVWAGAIKKDIKDGKLAGTAGGQASPVTLEVLPPAPSAEVRELCWPEAQEPLDLADDPACQSSPQDPGQDQAPPQPSPWAAPGAVQAHRG
jgi:hypothetical protein